jgi:tripartite-type tricarboxylate transporter receptor subunit TctC
MGEFLSGYEASGWYGIAAPKATLPRSSRSSNQEINAAFADPKMKERLADLGCLVFAGSPADFGMFIAGETDKWAKVIRTAGIKAE